MSAGVASGLRPGDVILLLDGTVRPPKYKRFICVVAAEGWFLRINTERHFRPHLPVRVRDNPGWLDHDSFVELRGVIEHDPVEIAEALCCNDARVLGRLIPATASDLAAAVLAAPTFREDEAAQIVAALRAVYGAVI